jgi:hypothetical protein
MIGMDAGLNARLRAQFLGCSIREFSNGLPGPAEAFPIFEHPFKFFQEVNG